METGLLDPSLISRLINWCVLINCWRGSSRFCSLLFARAHGDWSCERMVARMKNDKTIAIERVETVQRNGVRVQPWEVHTENLAV